ncbi:cytochrome P450 [Streptomyces sp. NPDC020379]|uniref:cytochrome P450 n=1 Tax=Streptomyces sp. NPDC020379 TaxID=3365071 RepID=UPI0037A46B43
MPTTDTTPPPTTEPCPPAAECPVGVSGATFAHSAGDPRARYAHLRAEHPVHHDDELRLWVVSRHHDIAEVLRDQHGNYTTTLSYTPVQEMAPAALAVLEQMDSALISSIDPPEHTRRRRALNAVWPTTAKQLTAHQPAIDARITSHVGDLASRPARACDLVTDLARPLTTEIMADLIGIPDPDRPAIGARSACLADLVWGQLTDTQQENAARALDEIWHYCNDLVDRHADRPQDDLTTAMLEHRSKDGEQLTRREIASTLVDVVLSNAELTSRLLANTLYHVLRTGTYRHLADRPEHIPAAVQETLRHDTPLTGWLRATTRATELAGVHLPAGARLLLLLGSAPHDESHRVADPEQFDHLRTDTPPTLAFGAGIHYCPGAPLSLHTTASTVTALTRALPGLTLTDDPVNRPESWPTNLSVRSPGTLTAHW